MANLLTKEHYGLMAQFEREHSGRFDREEKSLWPKGIVYQDGRVNELFMAYRRGYAFCEADMRSDIQNLEASRDGYRADAERLESALAAQGKSENIRTGAPFDDPKFEALAREHDVWGRASSALCAVFWRAGKASQRPDVQPPTDQTEPSGNSGELPEDDSIALDRLADYIADTWPTDKKYDLEEICQRLHAMWPGAFMPAGDE